MRRNLAIGAILALLAAPVFSQSVLAEPYVTHVQAMNKLQDVDPACLSVAKYYVPDGNCLSQTYVVQFADAANQQYVEASQSDSLAASLAVANLSAFNLNGFELADLARDPRVLGIAANVQLGISGTQTSAPSHLDRTDQAALPLNQSYSYKDQELGAGVRVYIVDTGVNSSHTEFSGRLAPGYSSVGPDTTNTEDCNGHGTHVAGLAAGTTYGAAKAATIVPVRVLGCDGNGSLLGVLLGLDWVAKNTNVGEPAVVNMSLGGEANSYLNNAVTSLTDQGLAFVVAAGNTGTDACNTEPARVAGAITVAASSQNDTWPSFSNFGSCVDIVAPGVALTSAWIGTSSDVTHLSGTSMAAAVVSGIVATQMSYGYQTPTALSDALSAAAVKGIITGIPAATANSLLQNTVSFTVAGVAPGQEQTPIDLTGDESVISVDPIADPAPAPGAPSSPALTVPTTYAKPTVAVTESSVIASWVIPQQINALTGQTLRLYSGSLLIAEYQLGSTANSYLLTQLATGVVYSVTIAGINLNGVGVFSANSESFTLAGAVLYGPDGGEFSAWTKKISDTQVKFYSKYPQLNQKIQFMVQGKDGVYREIGWTRISADRLDANDHYTDLTNGVYFIRTINLREGKNRLRILVDGVQLGSTRTYAY